MAVVERPTIKKLKQLREAAAHARRPFEVDWWLNMAFNDGEQYSEWSPSIENVRRIPRQKDDHSPRPVVNKIGHFIEQQHGFALQTKPVPDVIPASADLISESNAQVALAYCNYVASPEVTGFPSTLSRAVLWALITGPAWLKWVWDPVAKRPAIYAVSPFELYPDPYAQEWAAVRYVIHSRFMDPEQVYDLYGKEIKTKAERVDETRARLLRSMGAAPVVEGVTVNELWMKPSRRFPGGLYAVWVGDEMLVEPQELPYTYLREHRKLPFTPIGVIPKPGTIYHDSHVKRMRSPQMELNKFHAQTVMIRENFASPKWWAPEELELQEQPNNAPNQVLRGSGESGMKPEIIQATSMVSGQDGEWIAEEMMNVVGLHEVSQAQVPGRVESAKAIEMLKEADASRLSELLRTMSEAIAEGYWQILMQAKQFESPKKMISTYSEDGFAEVQEFRAREVDPGIRFHVTMGTGLGYTRAGRTDAIMELLNLGMFQDDPNRVLSLLDIGGNLPLSPAADDIRTARNENYRMAHGEAIVPNYWDDHARHRVEHNRYRKSREYELLPTRAKAIFEMHVTGHDQLLLKRLQQDAVEMAVQQGAALQGGGEAPPEDGQPAQEGESQAAEQPVQ